MILLSYPLEEHMPVYGNGNGLQVEEYKQIKAGDSCNTVNLSFPNHVGTHIDCPAHFDQNGNTLTDYKIDFWFCRCIQVLFCNLSESELCTKNHLERAFQKSSQNDDAEMVILVTGWHQKRNELCYWQNPPGFQPDVSQWLRKTFPKIRFFGFDLISLSSYSNRDIGREAHQAFLCHYPPILLIEDMNLSSLYSGLVLNSLLISPLIVDGIDGGPCTIWGNI